MWDKELPSLESAIRFAFLYTDMECRMQELMSSGCTCATSLVMEDPTTKEKRLVTANIGDSRIVLSRGGMAVRLSYVGVGRAEWFISRITKPRIQKK